MKLFVFIFGVVLISGCLTTEKATSFLRKNNALANICDSLFPYVPQKIDSTAYIAAVEMFDSILRESDKSYDELFFNNKILRDSLSKSEKVLDDQISKYIFSLEGTVEKLNRDLSKKPKTLPPLIQPVLDSSGKQALRDQNDVLRINNEQANKELLKEKDRSIKFQGRYNKWMWLSIGTWILLLLLLVAYLYGKK